MLTVQDEHELVAACYLLAPLLSSSTEGFMFIFIHGETFSLPYRLKKE
jgi:hypothetical protein